MNILLKLTREGFLKIERIGPVYLSGLTIAQAKLQIKKKLSKIYSGINSNALIRSFLILHY